jgi:hypothetical protein
MLRETPCWMASSSSHLVSIVKGVHAARRTSEQSYFQLRGLAPAGGWAGNAQTDGQPVFTHRCFRVRRVDYTQDF